VVCSFCGASVFFERRVVAAADYRRAYERFAPSEGEGDSEREVWAVGGRRYRLHGCIASGHSSDVMLAETATALPQRVVIKVLRAAEDEALFQAEQRTLESLAASDARGATHFRRLVPELIAVGMLSTGQLSTGQRSTGQPRSGRRTIVSRYASGFVHTLADVREVHGDDIDPRHAVWIWRRLLEVLGWIHQSGFRHGAVLPQHVLIHARDHGLRLAGFSLAGRHEEALPGRVDPNYPAIHSTDGDDVAASARLVSWLLGGDAKGGDAKGGAAAHVPAPLADLLVRESASRARDGSSGARDAVGLASEVGRVAHGLYGPPKFVRLSMPGW
jgi:hypothetical protein